MFEHCRRNSGNSPFVKAEDTQTGAGSGGQEHLKTSNRVAEEEKEKKREVSTSTVWLLCLIETRNRLKQLRAEILSDKVGKVVTSLEKTDLLALELFLLNMLLQRR